VAVGEPVPGGVVGRSLWRADFYLGARAERKKKARGGREEAARSGLNPSAGLQCFLCVGEAFQARSVAF
jgi:hypothetical protein